MVEEGGRGYAQQVGGIGELRRIGDHLLVLIPSRDGDSLWR